MKVKLFSLRCAILLAVLAIHSDLSLGQNKAPTQRGKLPAKILAFLRPDGEMRKYRATFTGEVTPLPEDLQKALELRLYLHRFTIVRMRVDADITSWGFDLIIVTDAKSGEVVSYAWQNR